MSPFSSAQGFRLSGGRKEVDVRYLGISRSAEAVVEGSRQTEGVCRRELRWEETTRGGRCLASTAIRCAVAMIPVEKTSQTSPFRGRA